MAPLVEALETKISFIAQEVEQQFVAIEEANPPSEMRRVVVPSMQQTKQVGQATTQPLNVPLAPAAP